MAVEDPAIREELAQGRMPAGGCPHRWMAHKRAAGRVGALRRMAEVFVVSQIDLLSRPADQPANRIWGEASAYRRNMPQVTVDESDGHVP